MPTYRVTKTVAGGYSVRPTDLSEQAADSVGGAAALAGGLAIAAIGASLGALRRSAERARSENIEKARDEMARAASAGKWKLERSLAVKFAADFPREPVGYAMMAEAAIGLRNWDEALSAAQKLEECGGHPGDLAMLRSAIYLETDRAAEIFPLAATLIDEQDTRAAGYYFRSQAFLWLGDLDQALTDANRANDIEPTASVYRLKGDIAWANGDLHQAVSEYTRSLRLAPGSDESLDKRGAVLELLGDVHAAEADRERSEAIREARRPPSFLPTHRVQGAGASRWLDLQGSRQSDIDGRTEVQLLEESLPFAKVRTADGESCWVLRHALGPISDGVT